MNNENIIYKIIDGHGEHRRLSRRFLLFGIFIFVTVATFSFMVTRSMKITHAADLSQFKAGNIISDEVMRNYTSMTEQEIQAFLHSKNSCNKSIHGMQNFQKINPEKMNGVEYNYQYRYGSKTFYYHVVNDKFVCLADEKFDGETAAHIIYETAKDYKINPQVLMVLIEKEQGLISDTWPNVNFQYRSATGYGCPDTAACDAKFYGLKNQIRKAAELFNSVLSGGWTNYPLGWNNIRYSPDPSCGSSKVFVENLATSALYRYTPYQPNAGAINAYTGTAACGAYGNRNFYIFFNNWFGSTQKSKYTYAQNYYNSNKTKTGILTGETICLNQENQPTDSKNDGDYSCYQDFEKGTLFWNTSVISQVKTEKNAVFYDRADAIEYKKLTVVKQKDPIYQTWIKERKNFGQIIGEATAFTKDQNFRILKTEKSVIFGNDKIGYHQIKTKAFELYQNNYQTLGQITSGLEKNSATKAEWYTFKNGYIVGNDQKGWFVSTGKIREVWASHGYEFGSLGFGLGEIIEDEALGLTYQKYENGIIAGDAKNGYSIVNKQLFELRQKYASALGAPTAVLARNDLTKIEWYTFKNGYIVGNDQKGWYISIGKSREVWARKGFESGPLGFPTSDFQKNSQTGIEWQNYENGVIVGNDQKGWYISIGKSREVWARKGFESGPLGFPTSDFQKNSQTGIEWQNYENGVIVGNDQKGWYESRGNIRLKWQQSGFENGRYGFPKSDIENGHQLYEGGYINQ